RQRRFRVAAHHAEFRERCLIEYDDAFTAGLVLAADGLEPVLPAVAVAIESLLARSKVGKPVRPLPAELLAEHPALRRQAIIERRAPERTPRRMLLERPGHGVVLGVGLHGARTHPVGVEVIAPEAADIDWPEIVRRLAFGDPLGQRHAGTAARRDAKGIE